MDLILVITPVRYPKVCVMPSLFHFPINKILLLSIVPRQYFIQGAPCARCGGASRIGTSQLRRILTTSYV